MSAFDYVFAAGWPLMFLVVGWLYENKPKGSK